MCCIFEKKLLAREKQKIILLLFENIYFFSNQLTKKSVSVLL